MSTLVEMCLFTISANHFLFSKFCIFDHFLRFFFRFREQGATWEKKLQATSPLILRNRFTKNPCILLGRVSSKVVKSGEISNFGFLHFFFSFSLTWDHMGETTSTDILSASTQQICSQKFMHSPRKGLYQSCIKIVKFINPARGLLRC